MKMFIFVKKVFVLGLAVLSSSITGALNCASTNNQECKGLKLLMLVVITLYFILLVLKLIGVVVIVIVLMIHMQRFVFLML